MREANKTEWTNATPRGRAEGRTIDSVRVRAHHLTEGAKKRKRT
jgi:hypothetical protein